MSKSLDFCTRTASDPTRSSYSDRDWSKAWELHSTRHFIDDALEGIRKYTLQYDDNGNKNRISIELILNANADFQHFSSESFVSDGSPGFLWDSFDRLTRKVLCGKSYYANLRKPQDGDTIEITIGNLVVLTEHGDYGTEEKPWLEERNTVLLPIAMRYI